MMIPPKRAFARLPPRGEWFPPKRAIARLPQVGEAET
jgi:hypothetical protein